MSTKPNTIKQGDTFPVCSIDIVSIGFKLKHSGRIRATYIGTVRKPNKGEWFLGGTRPTAYRAKHNLDSKYPIARLSIN